MCMLIAYSNYEPSQNSEKNLPILCEIGGITFNWNKYKYFREELIFSQQVCLFIADP